ncbi:MAG: hypothetical protein WAU28_05830, partial [Candidatus Moraniibacteriota bacterium]
MEPIPNEGGQNLSSLFSFFSFSEWKKSVHDPKMRRVELALIFGIGILLGIVLKDIARNTVTIGYQDYTVHTLTNRIDFNDIEREVLRGEDASSSS